MINDARRFEVTDPFGRSWNVIFLWHQTGISIRHADTVDVKFQIHSGDEHIEKVIALNHPDLLAISKDQGRPLTDSWCMKLAALHLQRMIQTWEDMEKTLITVPRKELDVQAAALLQPAGVED